MKYIIQLALVLVPALSNAAIIELGSATKSDLGSNFHSVKSHLEVNKKTGEVAALLSSYRRVEDLCLGSGDSHIRDCSYKNAAVKTMGVVIKNMTLVNGLVVYDLNGEEVVCGELVKKRGIVFKREVLELSGRCVLKHELIRKAAEPAYMLYLIVQ